MEASQCDIEAQERLLDAAAAADDPLCCAGIQNLTYHAGVFLSNSVLCFPIRLIYSCTLGWIGAVLAAIGVLPRSLRLAVAAGGMTAIVALVNACLGTSMAFSEIPTVDTNQRRSSIRALLWLVGIASVAASVFAMVVVGLAVVLPATRRSKFGLRCGLLWIFLAVGAAGVCIFFQLGFMSGLVVLVQQARDFVRPLAGPYYACM